MTTVELFKYFITEREEIRKNRGAKLAQPWTKDPILQTYRFCNVNREHDAVTRWMATHVRPTLDAERSLRKIVVQLLLCRVFNEPETLKVLFPFDDRRRTHDAVQELRAMGKKVFRGAYIVVPHGTAGLGRSTEDYFLEIADKVREKDFSKVCTLRGVADVLTSIHGIGDFLANQVCTDLRYQKITRGWSDLTTFVLAGPGTRRGLYRYMHNYQREHSPGVKGDCQPLLMRIRQALWTRQGSCLFSDPNNLSNCFCEFDKYMRARAQVLAGNRVTLHRYA